MSVVVDVVAVVVVEDGVGHVEYVIVGVAAAAVVVVDEGFVVEKKMTDDGKNVVVVAAAVWLTNQMIIPLMDQMVISFEGISYGAATVVADAVEDFVHQNWDWGR